MIYKTVYDKPGRIRVRYGIYAFDKYSVSGVSDYIKLFEFVKSVNISHANGSVLIYYEADRKEELLKVLDSLTGEKIQQLSLPINHEIEENNKKFKNDIAMAVIRREILKWFMPVPIMRAITALKAYRYFIKAIKSLSEWKLTVDTLDFVTISAAILNGDYSTANNIMFLLGISDMLEEHTMKSAKLELAKSLAINVDYVWAIEDGVQVKKPLSELKKGDVIVVNTGNVIPVDATVVDSEAFVNQSSMTGESKPVRKYNGLSVYAGTVVEEGNLKLKVTAFEGQTRISKILDMIEKSQDLKASLHVNAQRRADMMVPFSLLSSAALYLLTGNVARAMSILVVDYSCAIKMSTPISVISAIRQAAGKSILVKGGKFLENYANADTLVLDKTGTLTNAKPKLAKVVTFFDYEENEVLKIAACLEEHFPHPVARSIVDESERRNIIHEEEHTEVEYVVAHGISSRLNGEKALIGSRHFIEDDEKIYLTCEQEDYLKNHAGSYSTLFLALDDKIVGMFFIEDPVRADAKETIDKLKEQGIKDVIMITGDSESSAKDVSEKLGITKYYSQVLPDEKYKIIKQLKEEGRIVAMVGDGINDSPALSVADVSISMKDASDMAKEVADITLLSSNLSELVTLRLLSKKLLSRIKNNYMFIATFNSSLIAFGIMQAITPSALSLLHNTSTLLLCASSTTNLLKE